MGFIRGIFTEDNGNFSSKRFIALLWFIPMSCLWIYLSIKNNSIQEIPNGAYMVSGVIAGMLAVGKFGEEKNNG